MAAGIDGRKYSGAKCYVSARTLEEEAEEEGGRRRKEEGGTRGGTQQVCLSRAPRLVTVEAETDSHSGGW